MTSTVQRFGAVVKVRPEQLEEYRTLHAAVWPTVLATLAACHVSNYSIFYRDGLLFSYMEYDGNDWVADSAKMAADPETQRWWTYTDACQQPVESAADGELWAPMENVFFMA